MELTLKQVFILNYFHRKNINYSIPGYFVSEYGADWKVSLDFLLDNHYLELSDYKDNLQKITVNDLKSVLEYHNIKAKGKKQNFIDALLENVPHDELAKRFSHATYYKLTEKGNEELLKNEIYIINRAMFHFAPELIKRKKAEMSNASNSEIFRALYLDETKKYIVSESWRELSAVCFRFSRFLIQEGRHKEALPYICASMFIDLSGMKERNQIEFYDFIYLLDGSIVELKRILFACELSNDEFKKFFCNDAVGYYPPPPFMYFTLETMADMIIDCLNGEIYKDVKTKYPFNEPEDNNPRYTLIKPYFYDLRKEINI